MARGYKSPAKRQIAAVKANRTKALKGQIKRGKGVAR